MNYYNNELKLAFFSIIRTKLCILKYQCYPLYRKRRLTTKSEDAIRLEPMETPMSERKTNVYFDDSDGTTLICFKDLINHYQF